jgi:hypothetical protein
MPNVKIYVDEALYAGCREGLAGVLGPLREMLCDELQVAAPACQFAVLPVLAMSDLPPVNVEVQIMPRPDRSRALLLRVAETLREMVGAATQAHVAIRITTLDPETYIALK